MPRPRAPAHARSVGWSRGSAAVRALHFVRRAANAGQLQQLHADHPVAATTVLLQEMIHDARVVPMTAKPHLPKSMRQLHGDPRGRWEGDTLVVETTNYINGFQGSTPDVKLTERYTRVSPDFINWEIDRRGSRDVDQAVHVHDPAEEGERVRSTNTPATRATTRWKASSPARAPKRPRPAAPGRSPGLANSGGLLDFGGCPAAAVSLPPTSL